MILEVRSPAPAERVRELVAHAERGCHAEQSLRAAVPVHLAATGLVHPVWAMVAMAASVTTIFVNSIGARPRLLFAAISSVGRHSTRERPTAVAS